MSDILVIGGGIIGLAIALELQRRGAIVTVLSRNSSEAAALAAAGMLAPQAEQIPPSPMLDLCLASRDRYPEWIGQLASLSGKVTGYWPCGILAPLYDIPLRTGLDRGGRSGTLQAEWLDATTIHQRYPGLGSDVQGGWWYAKDAQVDNRALMTALRTAALEVGVNLQEGVEVLHLETLEDRVIGLDTTNGYWQADRYVLATGAWAQALLPIPVTPCKGQMLSVSVDGPDDGNRALPLECVLFGDESYIVPRQNGQIVIGATSEAVGFAPHNTASGIHALLSRATRLFPRLGQMPISELWWGFRPATPDEGPILGESSYRNLTLATGHYRNGVLLAPITALLIADWLTNRTTNSLLEAFHWSRFAAGDSRPYPNCAEIDPAHPL